MKHRPKKRGAEEEAILAPFRTPGPCEFCGKPCRLREPAHVVSRGAGGPSHALNLVALGSSRLMCCPCHSISHAGGRPNRTDLLDIVARREGLPAWKILEMIWEMRREKTQGATA